MFSKLNNKKKVSTSKAVKAKNGVNKSTPFKHEFCVLSADEINSKRSKAYQYLSL